MFAVCHQASLAQSAVQAVHGSSLSQSLVNSAVRTVYPSRLPHRIEALCSITNVSSSLMHYASHEIASVTQTLTIQSYNMAPLDNTLWLKITARTVIRRLRLHFLQQS